MDEKLVQQVFEELLPSLEALDTKCAAILQFLKTKGIATDEELAPYLEQAGNASSVRWRAARVRMNHLLSTPPAEEKDNDKETPSRKAAEKTSEPSASKKGTEAEGQKPEKEEGEVKKTTDNDQTESASSEQPEEDRKDSPSPEHQDKNAA